ncbi:hypothetical protein [Mucilaginibacter gotjawali]|uniref:Uncharacterized protein n=2 Tax=Mucilaginibacter gotjawali TaxID=1550579 RepID=A0A839SL14_9SPHI|nr:hypothetical protein [Mucilaginibacter gotjawali]MBB3057219.1 hypothetical protein [Mucilaginibacter gotjawali]BAU53014.1 hypothetical protein MgSA37_01181 [Mucilaginibacter gotjawali]
MKKTFTKLFSAALLTGLTIIGFSAKAQSTSLADNGNTPATVVKSTTTASHADYKPETIPAATAATTEVKAKAADPDTAWKPQRRVWGYTFGDFYYTAHADNDFVSATGVPEGGAGALSKRGGETNYSGVPTYRNAFQFRRVYLGYDYEITKKFKAEFLLASEPGANTNAATGTTIQNGDNLVDGKMALWIKNANLRVRDLWTGTDFVIGMQSTPGFALNEAGTNGPTSLSEATWGYRSIEKTITDFHKNNSYDLGASLQGTFDPATKNFGYVVMLGNNSQASLLSAANANTGFYKIVYGDLWAKFFDKKLFLDIYADAAKTAPATAAIGGQQHNMFKIFAAYNTKPITIGVEAYTQSFTNGVTNSTTKTVEDATAQGLSIWVKGGLAKNLNYFARYDTYNPDTKFTAADSYAANTNYSSYTPTVKEQFYTAGLDYTPYKNVHFEPNVWLVDYKDQRTSTTTGYVAPDHTLVFRFTFFFTFGK